MRWLSTRRAGKVRKQTPMITPKAPEKKSEGRKKKRTNFKETSRKVKASNFRIQDDDEDGNRLTKSEQDCLKKMTDKRMIEKVEKIVRRLEHCEDEVDPWYRPDKKQSRRKKFLRYSIPQAVVFEENFAKQL